MSAPIFSSMRVAFVPDAGGAGTSTSAITVNWDDSKEGQELVGLPLYHWYDSIVPAFPNLIRT